MLETLNSSVGSEILEFHGNFGSQVFELSVDDRDVIDAISRYEQPETGIHALLKIGACASLATAVGYDISAVRKEIDRLMSDTSSSVATLRGHVLETMGADGPLAEALAKTCTDLDSAVRELLENEGNPAVPESLLGRMQGLATHYKEVLDATRKEISESFENSATRHAERIDRALGEMRDLDPSSSIGQAFKRLEDQLGKVQNAISASQATAQERQRGTAKGGDFEDLVTEKVAAIASVFGDLAEHTGNQPGQMIQAKGQSKRGDVTCMIDGSPAIVLEIMDRGKSELTLEKVKAELKEAMQNRSATAAIAVVSSTDNRLMNGQPLQVLESNLWAVVLDKDLLDVLALQVAYRLARQAARLATTQVHVVDFGALKCSVTIINEKLNGLSEVKTQLSNIGRSQESAITAVMRVEREMRIAINSLLEDLEAEADESSVQAEVA